MLDRVKSGKIYLEVSLKVPENLLNLLWNMNIKAYKIKRVNISTIDIEIDYENFEDVKDAVKRCKGKLKVLRKSGLPFFKTTIKKKVSILVGALIFLGGLYVLSTYMWAIEINTKENIPPFEIRKQLYNIGIKPGMAKRDVDVYKLEKDLEDINSDILWIRARIEGSTLKIFIEEKVSPPAIKEGSENDCLAKTDGQIKRIFVNSGTAAVQAGDMVKEGDVLISASQGKEDNTYPVQAKGTVIANTFYEKEMEVQISGNVSKSSGKKDKDIYLNILGKKIYLKKSINNYADYDKIEENSGFVNSVTYYERNLYPVNIDKDSAICEAEQQLENSLKNDLSNDAKICDKNVYVENIDENKIRVKIMFLVEEDIVLNGE